MDLEKLNMEVDKFVEERKWEKYHITKNLVMALSGEIGELNECFQWLSNKEIDQIKNIPEKLVTIEHEIADVFIYIVRIANKMGIDIEDVVYKKMELNRLKYPIETNQGIINKT